MKEFYSHGKLLLSGEYLVLDGALSLAVPTRLGQWLRVRDAHNAGLSWRSLNPDGSPWFETNFSEEELQGTRPMGGFPSSTRERLKYFLLTCQDLNPDFSETLPNTEVETFLEFPRQWGLGTSSTLVANLALWADIDPYQLLSKTMGGSGYDIAAAGSDAAFYYQLGESGIPKVVRAPFEPVFSGELFFVYLNEKQDSRESVSRYRTRRFHKTKAIMQASELTRKMASAGQISLFREAVDRHEELIGEILGLEPIKKRYFPDYPGSIKSLGAWGGDFIMVTGNPTDQDYFRKKGYSVIKTYEELILN